MVIKTNTNLTRPPEQSNTPNQYGSRLDTQPPKTAKICKNTTQQENYPKKNSQPHQIRCTYKYDNEEHQKNVHKYIKKLSIRVQVKKRHLAHHIYIGFAAMLMRESWARQE